MAKNKAKTNEVVISLKNRIFYSLCALLVLLLPYFYLGFANDRTLMPRLLLLDIFLAAFIVVLYLRRREYPLDFSVLRNPLIIVFLLNFIITFLSQFVAINFVEGFFDTVKTFTMVLLCFLLIQLFLSIPDWPERLSKLVLIASVVCLIVGFYQYFDNVVLNSETTLPDGRPMVYAVKGLMGHKNFFSSSLMLMLPFLGFAVYTLKKTLKTIGIVAISLVVVLLVLLETRSVWVGTLVIGFVFVFTLVLVANKFGVSNRMRLMLATGLILAIIAFAGIVFTGGGMVEKTYFDRLKTITNPGSGNNPFRIRAWNATLEMIADYPLTGVGAGNWKIHSQKYLADKNFTQNQTNWIRPHNDYLWAFSERGVFGFLLYLALFGVSVFYVVRLLMSEKTDRSVKIVVLILLSGIAGYMFESFFAFPYERINQQVYLTIFMAGITAEYLRIKPQKEYHPSSKTAFALSGLVLLFSIVYGLFILKSEFHIVRAKAAEKSKIWNLQIEEALKAKTPFRTLEPDASPIDYYVANGYLESGNLKKAIYYYEKALKASPFDPFIWSNLGKAFTDMGEYQKAVAPLEKSIELLPAFFEAKVNLGTVYYQLQQYRKALKVLNSIPRKQRNKTINGNIEALKKLLPANPANKQTKPSATQQ